MTTKRGGKTQRLGQNKHCTPLGARKYDNRPQSYPKRREYVRIGSGAWLKALFACPTCLFPGTYYVQSWSMTCRHQQGTSMHTPVSRLSYSAPVGIFRVIHCYVSAQNEKSDNALGSLVQVEPLKATLLRFAKGLASVVGRGVHRPVTLLKV